MRAKDFFTETEKTAIEQAIAAAELNTSGEIRLRVETKCKIDPKVKAIEIFQKLNMHRTDLRNAVLFYLAIEDQKFSIIGDKGINEAVPGDFWDSIRDEMVMHFKQKQFTLGLCAGIQRAGEKLKFHFPYQEDDKNELSDEISFE
ncbi:MAG: TPM domain-containing protein [Crocinitomicaceae bacterium]|nr:TPM domain-containing protein [Crocinitomicaceae bacterium]